MSITPDDPQPLFRPEVSERNWELLASQGLLSRAPASSVVVIAFLLCVFAGGGIFLARGAIPRVESAPGYLEPAGGVTRVRAPRQAIVGEIRVKEGQLVNLDDPLVTLHSGQMTESGQTAETEIAGQLNSQHRDLEAQIAREADWRNSEDRRLTATVDALVRDIELLEDSSETQRQQLALAKAQVERIRELSNRGTVSADELQRRQITALALQLDLQRSEREQADKRAQLLQARIALEQLPTVASERVRTLRDALANMQQRQIELDARRAVLVRAPISGRIATISALAGSSVEPGGLLATIVPDDAQLHARVLVPTRSIGKMHGGEPVSLRYEAFPYQKYGTFKGWIVEVSSSVLLPQEIEKISPMRLNEPAYLVYVSIERKSVTLGEGRQAPLRPDMLLSAIIEIDRRPLLAWVGDSVFGVSQD